MLLIMYFTTDRVLLSTFVLSSVVFMLLAVETVAGEEVHISMAEVAEEDVEKEMNEVEEDISEEVV